MDKDTLQKMTGLTFEDLMDLLVEGSYALSDAYGLTKREDYFKTANLLKAARNNLFHYACRERIEDLSKLEVTH